MPRRPEHLTRFARRMRQDSTRAEANLWWVLRGRTLGVKFRRQEPIGPYIADFACWSHRIIIEIDGPTHWNASSEEKDRQRDAWFRRRGWRVLRTTDDEVWTNLDGVVEWILQELELRMV
jgi:very-short-patch-repair endonuclease